MRMIFKFYCQFCEATQIEKSLCLLEKELSTQKLDKTITNDGTLLPITDRLAFLEKGIMIEKKIPLISNGELDNKIQYSGYFWSIQFVPDPFDLWYIIIEIKEQAVPANLFANLMEGLAHILKPFWATLNREDTELITGYQLQPTVNNKAADLGLPRLNSVMLKHKPEIPSYFAWINYWSRETVMHCLAATHKLKEILFLEKDFEDGSKIMQLTRDALSFQNKDHLETIIALYNSVPEVGSRV